MIDKEFVLLFSACRHLDQNISDRRVKKYQWCLALKLSTLLAYNLITLLYLLFYLLMRRLII